MVWFRSGGIGRKDLLAFGLSFWIGLGTGFTSRLHIINPRTNKCICVIVINCVLLYSGLNATIFDQSLLRLWRLDFMMLLIARQKPLPHHLLFFPTFHLSQEWLLWVYWCDMGDGRVCMRLGTKITPPFYRHTMHKAGWMKGTSTPRLKMASYHYPTIDHHASLLGCTGQWIPRWILHWKLLEHFRMSYETWNMYYSTNYPKA